MSSISGSQGFARIVLCLSLSLGPAMVAVDAAGAEPRKARTQTTKPAAKPKSAKPVKPPATKQKAREAAAEQLDAVTELEIINGEALALNRALAADPDNAEIRQKLALLALRAARAAERALSRGDDELFAAYREQFRSHFAATRPGLEAMAGRGIGAAEFALGVLDLHGMLGERDVARACAHFAVALDKDFGGARYRHARCIEEKEPERAAALMREAADGGHVGAIEQLGRICLEATPPDVACALARLERAAREGRLSATTLLGWMQAEGIGGKADPARAAGYYREAAGKGDTTARNNLGELYERGRGVGQDLAKAFDHYLLAALAGFPPAQFNLGRLFATGQGTARDLEQARHWLGEAAKAGIAPARLLLDHLDREAAAK
ncbi:MAG: sel1 repeat family protein [Sulfuritalea sp.]|jgi:TPR repeat protein|nr:sel1 repeat family protein [Sulfuritalea sp.]